MGQEDGRGEQWIECIAKCANHIFPETGNIVNGSLSLSLSATHRLVCSVSFAEGPPEGPSKEPNRGSYRLCTTEAPLSSKSPRTHRTVSGGHIAAV